jgi:type I restriction enzyme, S subunit
MEAVMKDGKTGWEKVKLGDVVKLVTGKTPPTGNSNYFGGNFLWINPSDFGSKDIIESKRKLTRIAILDRKCNVLPKGSVLLSCIGDIGKVGILRMEGSTNQQITALIPSEKVIPDFLYYYLVINKSKLEALSNKAVVAILNNEKLKNLEIPLPPLETQKRIAEILDTADALRRKDEELLKKYEDLAQAIFIDMFGDPVKNEKGWEVKEIKYFGKVQTGNTPPRAIKEYYGSHIEWIKTDNIILDKIYLQKSSEYLSEKGLKKGRSVDSGSILVTCIAGSSKSIGNVAITDRKVSFNQQINSLTPNEEYNSIFIYSLFRNCKTIIQENTTQGMKRIITKSVFENIKLISPPKFLQDQYEESFNMLIQNKRILNIQIESSQNLFNSLIQKAFNGELVN